MSARLFVQSVFIAVTGTHAALAQGGGAAQRGGQEPTPHTPAACLQAANDYRMAQVVPVARGGPGMDPKTALAKSREMALACAKPLRQDPAHRAMILELIPLYTYIGDTALLHGLLTAGANSRDMPPPERAGVLTAAIAYEVGASQRGADGKVPLAAMDRAEAYAAALDQLPDSLDAYKLRVHQTLVAYYEYIDVDLPLLHEAEALLSVARRAPAVTPKEDTAKARLIASAYRSLARVPGDLLHADSALMVLDRAGQELATLRGGAAANATLGDLRRLYALVGTRGTPIHGDHWLNAPASLGTVPVGGKVILLQFTAHWCIPCRNSYPGMVNLSRQFANEPFEAILETDLYGYFGTEGPIGATEELAADQRYYVEEHDIRFPVAINDHRAAGSPSADSTDSQRYAVGGIPQIVVIDKRGIIRAVVTGWDAGNEVRLAKLIAELLRQ